ncbi:unnamed protein product, partial [Closterium sp. Naga37s-1]
PFSPYPAPPSLPPQPWAMPSAPPSLPTEPWAMPSAPPSLPTEPWAMPSAPSTTAPSSSSAPPLSPEAFTDFQSPPQQPQSGGGLSVGVIAGIAVGAVMLLIIGVLLWWRIQKKRAAHGAVTSCEHTEGHGMKEDPEEEAAAMAAVAAAAPLPPAPAAAMVVQDKDVVVEMGLEMEKNAARPHVCQEYPLEELERATGKWAEENRIGSGSFGDVYKGVSPQSGSQMWAVKRARVLSNDFLTE